MYKVLGVTLIVLALALAVVPRFTDCQSQGKAIELASGKTVPMKCHWTGVAEIGVAAPLLALGAMITVNRRKSSLMPLGIMGVVLGALAVSFPAGLIGVCQNPMMLCASVMKPVLITLGSVAAAVSLGVMVLERSNKI